MTRRGFLGGMTAGVAVNALPTEAVAASPAYGRLEDRIDGSSSLALQLTDWKSSPAFGETEAIRTTQFHTRTGARDVKVAIFHQTIALDPDRELRSITLPNLAQPRPHLFAVYWRGLADAYPSKRVDSRRAAGSRRY